MGKKAVLLFSITLIISSTFFTDFANAQTNVNSKITADTTWSLADSPVVFTGSIVVEEGVTLTIEDGVTVDMASSDLIINGTLKAVCNSSHPIKFTSDVVGRIIFDSASVEYNTADGTGCIIQNAEIDASVLIIDSAPIISGCQIKGGMVEYAVNVQQESNPKIISNTIIGKTVGVSFNFINNSYATNDYNAKVENNTIINCITGVGVGESQGTIQIYGNLISGATDAIKVANSTAAVSIQHNLVMNNTCGIYVGNQVAIRDNTIYNNTVGILYATTAQSLISYNNIMNNTQYNFETTSSSSLEATYNFWGTQDIPTINQTIYDKNNNESLGEVKYQPALDSPYAGAPMISNIDMNPTTTPTGSPNQTVQPTPTDSATPTPTQVEQGTFGTLEIGIIAALSIVIIIVLIIAFKKGKKCETDQNKPTT